MIPDPWRVRKACPNPNSVTRNRFHQEDLESLALGRQFDAICMMYVLHIFGDSSFCPDIKRTTTNQWLRLRPLINYRKIQTPGAMRPLLYHSLCSFLFMLVCLLKPNQQQTWFLGQNQYSCTRRSSFCYQIPWTTTVYKEKLDFGTRNNNGQI